MLIAVKAVVMVGAFMFGFFVLANSDLIKKNLVSAFGAKIMTISAIVLVLVLTPVGLFMGLFNFVMLVSVLLIFLCGLTAGDLAQLHLKKEGLNLLVVTGMIKSAVLSFITAVYA